MDLRGFDLNLLLAFEALADIPPPVCTVMRSRIIACKAVQTRQSTRHSQASRLPWLT